MLPNQCARITCTPPGSQSDNRMILWTINSVTCKSVFLLSSCCTYSVTYWCNWDEISVKLRQCVLPPEITTNCAKWLNSVYPAPLTVLRLFYVVALICQWLGIRYIRRSMPYKVGPPKNHQAAKCHQSNQQELLRYLEELYPALCLESVKLHIWGYLSHF